MFVILFWSTWIILPLKLLVVFFHEASHALATIVTGGKVISMKVDPMMGGMVVSSGGSRFIILSAGYLGSLIWGSAIFSLATHSKVDKYISIGLGVIVIFLTLFFVRNIFGILFSVIIGFFYIFSGLKLSHTLNDFLLKVTGLTSMIYVPLDVFSDVILHTSAVSDATLMASEIGGPAIIWGTIWIVLGVFIILIVAYLNIRNLPRKPDSL